MTTDSAWSMAADRYDFRVERGDDHGVCERGSRGGQSQGPVAYVISAIDGVVDDATVRRYAELTGPAIEHFRGRFIVSNSRPMIVEGESPSRHLSIVEFPSIEDARAWYDSPQYSEARALTPKTFLGRVLMFVEGDKGGS